MRFFGKFSWKKCRPLIVSLIGLKHQLINTSHESGSQSEEENEGRSECIRKIEAMASSFFTDNQVPGMAISVSVDHQTILHEGYGESDKNSKKPFTVDTKGDIASITKLMTLHCYMALHIRDNRPDLNPFMSWINGDKLRHHLPILPDTFYQYTMGKDDDEDEKGKRIKLTYQLREKNANISPALLFAHRAGIRQNHHLRDEENNKIYFHNETDAIKWFFERHEEENRHLFKFYPGNKFHYSNIGYLMLGAIMDYELREKMDPCNRSNYRDYVIGEMEKLGMNDTIWRKTSQLDNIDNYAKGYTHPLADGYFDRTKEVEESERDMDYSNFYPARGLISTVADLVKFGNAYLTMAVAKDKSEHSFPFSGKELRSMWAGHSVDEDEKKRDENTNLEKQTAIGMAWNIYSQQIDLEHEDDTRDAETNMNDYWFLINCYKNGRGHGFSSYLSVSYLTDGVHRPLANNFQNMNLSTDPQVIRKEVKEDESCESTYDEDKSSESDETVADALRSESSADSYPGDSKSARLAPAQVDASAGDADPGACYQPRGGLTDFLDSERCNDAVKFGSGVSSSHKKPKDLDYQTPSEHYGAYIGDGEDDDESDYVELYTDESCKRSDRKLVIQFNAPETSSCGTNYCTPGECKDGEGDEDPPEKESTPPPPEEECSDELSCDSDDEGSEDADSNENSNQSEESPQESGSNESSDDSVNLNPLITIGIIANLNSIPEKNLFNLTQDIIGEIREAAQNGAFPK